MLDQARDHKTLRPIVPVGWGHQNLYFVRMPSGWVFPIGQSIVKNDHLVVIFRGTMYVMWRAQQSR